MVLTGQQITEGESAVNGFFVLSGFLIAQSGRTAGPAALFPKANLVIIGVSWSRCFSAALWLPLWVHKCCGLLGGVFSRSLCAVGVEPRIQVCS